MGTAYPAIVPSINCRKGPNTTAVRIATLWEMSWRTSFLHSPSAVKGACRCRGRRIKQRPIFSNAVDLSICHHRAGFSARDTNSHPCSRNRGKLHRRSIPTVGLSDGTRYPNSIRNSNLRTLNPLQVRPIVLDTLTVLKSTSDYQAFVEAPQVLMMMPHPYPTLGATLDIPALSLRVSRCSPPITLHHRDQHPPLGPS